MDNQIDIALELAKKWHDDQRYGDEPYFNHLWRVYNYVKCAGYDENYQIVAFLHDIVEDTPIDHSEIHKFGDIIYDAIIAITLKKNEEYKQYVLRAATNPIAKVVKFYDVLDNYKHSVLDSRYEHLQKKYEEALHILVFNV
jgi:(p)ppGpp synthase/HD superfamily hydrolase